MKTRLVLDVLNLEPNNHDMQAHKTLWNSRREKHDYKERQKVKEDKKNNY